MDYDISYNPDKLSEIAEHAKVFHKNILLKRPTIIDYIETITKNWQGPQANLAKVDLNDIIAKLELIEQNAKSMADMLEATAENFKKIEY